MNIKIIIQNAKDGEVYDCSSSVSDLSFVTSVYDQPGKLTFKLNNNEVIFANGSTVQFLSDKVKVFFGYIFTNAPNEYSTSYIAFDQLRYLQFKDTQYTKDLTASGIFEKICKDREFKYKVVNKATKTLPSLLHKDKTFYEMIKWGIEENLSLDSQMCMIRDNFGVLEFLDVSKQKTDLIIGDNSILLEYDYERSIDKDTYNQVKIARDNEKTVKREVYIAKDSNSQKRWGTLQYFQQVDSGMNTKQIQQLAQTILKLKNRETRELKLKAIGSLDIKAGSGIKVELKGLINEWFWCRSVTHAFANNLLTMDLEMEVI